MGWWPRCTATSPTPAITSRGWRGQAVTGVYPPAPPDPNGVGAPPCGRPPSHIGGSGFSLTPPPVILSADNARTGHQRPPRRNLGWGRARSRGISVRMEQMTNPNPRIPTDEELRRMLAQARPCHSERRQRPYGAPAPAAKESGVGQSSFSQNVRPDGTDDEP